jgi:hypothetical protein
MTNSLKHLEGGTMKTSGEKCSVDEFAYEMNRKDQLLDLFAELEETEKKEKKALPLRTRKYDRIVNDQGLVKKVNESSVLWTRESGQKIEIPLTKKICDLLLVDDMLILTLGKRQKVWRIMHIIGIVSELGEKTHASFAVPKALQPQKPQYLN